MLSFLIVDANGPQPEQQSHPALLTDSSCVPSCHASVPKMEHCTLLLVNPVVLSGLPALDLAVLEPESNLLLAVLNGVGAVADVAANVEGVVATDGAGRGGEGVGGTENGAAGLDGVATFPDHGADGAGAHVCWSVSMVIGIKREWMQRTGN